MRAGAAVDLGPMSFRTRAHPASPGFARCWDVTAEGNTVVVGQGGHQVYGVPTSKPWRAVHLLLRTQRIALQVSACCLVESNQLRMNSTMVFDVSLLPEFFEPHPTADSSTADDVGAATQLLMQRIPHQLVADDLVVDSGSRDVDVVNDSGSPACPLSWGARDHDREHDRAPAGPCDARVEEPVGSAADRSKPEERLRDEIFDMVLPTKWTAELSAPAGLTCTLFRYQRRALAWMSWREQQAAGIPLLQHSAGPHRTAAHHGSILQASSSVALSGSSAGAQGSHPLPPLAASAGQQQQQPASENVGVQPPEGWLPSQALRHPLWEPVQFQTGLRIIYNAWTGEARRKLRDVPPAPAISGGILSDMMGLGKTVEVIAHILQCPAPYTRPSLHQPTASHGPAPQQGPLLRLSQANGGSSGQALAAAGPVHPGGTRCSLAAAPVPILALSAVSAEASLAAAPVAAVQVTAGTHEASIRHTATLIVCPVSILQQWQREFARHAPGVNVKVYEGLRWYQKEEEAKNKKAKKKKQVEVAPPLEYTYDMQEDARKAVAQLLEADVVLTTYWVLQQEVDFNPAVERLQSLRKPKKYQVPLSPLLHLRWWRLVLDEAQMVGSGLTAVAAMASRVVSHHRWAVTGTPVGPYGLHDVGNLLAVLGHDPFADARKWKECIIKPYEGGEPGASARLAAVLKPLMWRNSHAWVAADHPLPPRTLRIARLHFTPGERAFYNHIVSKTREARQAMEEKEAHPNEPAPPSPTAGASRKRKRRGGAAADEATLLREATERAVAQLRLACIHPQLTQYWKTLSGELQLEQGGALSMAEIMQRMCDGVQSELQSAERELCGTLNTLAQRLLAAKAPASRQRRKSAGPHKVHGQGEEEDLADEKGKAAVVDVEMLDGDADAGAYEEPGDEPGSPVSGAPAAKRAKLGVAGAPDSPVSPHRKKRRSASEYASSLEAHQARLQHAVEVLEQSLRVGEKGIEAMASKEALKKLNDISSANASIRAWRLIEASTAYHLAAAYSQTGREADAEAMRARLADKLADVRSSADEKLVKARSQVEQVADRVAGLKKRLGEEWAAAVSAGWPAEVEGDPRAWLDQLLADYQAAQAQEKQRRNTLEAGDGSTVQVLMGKEVQVALRAREEAALETRMGLEGVVGLPLLQDLVQRLQMAADCLAGRQSDLPARFASLERAQELPAFIPEHWLCWTAMSDASPETTVRIAVAMHQSCGALEVQRVERQVQRFLRAVEKYSKDKVQRSANMYPGQVLIAHCSRVATSAALECVRAKVELLRALREQHTALLNEELALFAVAQVEEDVMHAAKGEATSATAGPSGHKSIPELERLAASQKERCEKIAARRRFLQNNVKEAIAAAGGGESDPDELPTLPTEEAAAALPGQHAGPSAAGASLPTKPPWGDAATAVAGPHMPVYAFMKMFGPFPAPGSKSKQKGSAAAGQQAAEAAAGAAAFVPDSSLPAPTGVLPAGGVAGLSGAAPLLASPSDEAAGPGLPSAIALAAGMLASAMTCGPAAADTEEGSASGSAAVPASLDQTRPHAVSSASAAPAVIDLTTAAAAPEPTGSQPVADAGQLGSQLVADAGRQAAQQRQAGPSTSAAAQQSGQLAQQQDQHEQEQGPEASLPQCPCCLNRIQGTIIVFPCAHFACKSCWEQLFRQPQDKPKCMLCRRALTKANVFRVVSAHTAQTAVDEPKYLQIKVHGSYMSKIDALVRRLVHLRETRPDEKSLVFSQFPLALQLVAKALAVNNIGFSQLGTGRSNENRTALSTFIDGVKKEDPRKEDDKKGQREVHVFLLSLKAGAAGLTLVRANHVFLLEPAVDPAIAQQAIGRVHRIGQTRPVVVTRLLMDDTVEEHVMQAQERRQPLFLDSEPAEEPTSVDAPAPRGDTMAVAEMRGLLDAVLQ